MSLNDAQNRAVETVDGPVLIIAGAGSGKTRVIVHRILNLIRKGVPPHEILAITFTNKAAKEMRERVAALLSGDAGMNRPVFMNERPFVSTFHALGVHIIRENAHRLGLTRHFTIYDRGDSRRAIKESMEQCSVDPKRFDPGTVLNMISRAKGDGFSHIEYADRADGYLEEIVAQVWEKYDAILARDKALDFDDLLLKTAQLLSGNEDIRKRYSSIWRYIHVDEYQDTNRVQYKIARSLAAEHRNICVVGDADQNIYSWRGATIENIMNFEKDYPEATVVTLERNYRSTKTILAAANSVIEKNRVRKKKTLFTENESGDKIGLIVAYTESDEARMVADTARSLIADGASAKEIAVLYRTNFQSRAIEEAFIKKSIPYQLVGVRFFERKEVKDVLSYIRAALNRESWSDVGRIINVPARGIGKATVAKIMAKMEDSLPQGMREKIAGFWKLLEDIRREAEEKKPSETVRFVIQETGIERSMKDGDPDAEERLFNVRELASVAAQYDHLPGLQGIEALLENAALATDQDELQKDDDVVKLMTVHASKGLEFDHVFIAGMEQDLFPLKHLDEKDVNEAEEEEERRLFYVALTRAKKKVYLSYAVLRTVYGAQRINAPSEFLDDIDPSLIEGQEPEKPSGAKALFIDF
ncbi:MAG: UvrD-helicase domain-containing protein [Patescibacteria group bacterium]|nr:UvrD-helicase domain-containing protein [Patescibacteria group bacterium]MDE1940691.1 UvrD-helicase domain-containing protein [Patescibacteria group bacterium]MDE1966845.1 UvrD-helicase domain-containing protein [Patescibacteria group bacterium]